MKWRPWHRHAWAEVERTYLEPSRSTMTELFGGDNGLTTILFRCSTCGKHDKVEMPGKVLREDPLERMIRP